MRAENAIEKLCTIAPAVADIVDKFKNDDEYKEFVTMYKGDKNNNLSFVLRLLPLLKRDFNEQIYLIISTLTDKTIEEVKNESLNLLVSDIKTILEDEDIRTFFQSSTAEM